MLFPGRIYIARGPCTKRIFATSFCQIYVKTKNSPTIWAWGPGTVPHTKYGAGFCTTFIKSLDEGLR